MQEAVREVRSLAQVGEAMLSTLAEFKKGNPELVQLGYVSGIIGSDGPQHISRNRAILSQWAHELRLHKPFPLFAPSEIFTDAVYQAINVDELTNNDWFPFWRNILGARHITDIFMTPRWEESHGARDEYACARELGLRIHFVS